MKLSNTLLASFFLATICINLSLADLVDMEDDKDDVILVAYSTKVAITKRRWLSDSTSYEEELCPTDTIWL